MKVRVTQRGYYGEKLREPGEILGIPDAKLHKFFSHNWMEPVDPKDYDRLPPPKSERIDGTLVPIDAKRSKEILEEKKQARAEADSGEDDEDFEDEAEEQAPPKLSADPAIAEPKPLGQKGKKSKQTDDLNVI